MTLNNFSNKAERGVAEYYAGTMQPLGVHSSTSDFSYDTTSNIVPKHRRATTYFDYITYCNKSASTGFNIYIDNGIKQSVVNIKLLGSLTTHEFSGDWHLVSTDNGIRYFFPVVDTSGAAKISGVQYGEINIASSAVITESYNLYRSMTSSIATTPLRCAFVDVGSEVYMANRLAGNIGVCNVYFGGVENEVTQPVMNPVLLAGDGKELFTDYLWGISSFDSDKNFIFAQGASGSYGFSIEGDNDDYSAIFLKPAQKALLDTDDDDFIVDVFQIYADSSTIYELPIEDYNISRSPVTDGDETPLWHDNQDGIAFTDIADEYVSLLKGSISSWSTFSPLSYYAWFDLDATRAYYNYFDSSDQYYKTLSMIDGYGSAYEGIRQKDFDSDYAPVMIPVQNQKDYFITYYGVDSGVQYFYRTKTIPNIIENDKGIFYPQFLGEEEGSITLGESNYLRYERIGNIVHVFGVVQVASSTGVGALKMTNLPYPISNEFTDVDFTLDQAFPKLTPIKQAGSDYYTLYFCTSQSDQTLTSVATAVALTPRWVFNFRYMLSIGEQIYTPPVTISLTANNIVTGSAETGVPSISSTSSLTANNITTASPVLSSPTFGIVPTLITSNLVLHYNFEDSSSYSGSGTTINDLSTSSYSATALNGVLFNGTTPKSFDFDGVDDRLELQASVPNIRPNTTAFSANGFSISAWVQFDKYGFQGVFCTDGANYAARYYGSALFMNGSGYLGLEIGDGVGAGSQYRRTRISTFKPTLGQWYYVTANFDSLNAFNWNIYVDGSIVSMNSPSGSASSIGYSSTERAAVGVRRTNYLDGEVAMVHVYDRKLTSSEILQNYNATNSNFP
jgi:hypothetical protein